MNVPCVVPASLLLALALLGCRAEEAASGSRDPLPTAGSHQPVNPGAYATGAQETRDNEEAERADSPNDDGKEPDRDERPAELPGRSP